MPLIIEDLEKERATATAKWRDLVVNMEYNPNEVTLEQAEKLQGNVSAAVRVREAQEAGQEPTSADLEAARSLRWVTDTCVQIIKSWDVYATKADEEANNPVPIEAEFMRKKIPGGLLLKMVNALMEGFTFDPEEPSTDSAAT